MTDPLAFIKAANAKSKQRRARGTELLAASASSGVSAASGAEFAPMSGNAQLPAPSGKFLLPLAGALRITSPYGPRTHPIKGTSGFHTGNDYSAKQGTPVFAVADGVVRKATPNGGAYGNQVVVDVGGGLSGMYGHLQRFSVKAGQRVRKGQVIGYVGTTGLSTGPHLHFETWYKGKPVNPDKYLR